MIDVKKYWKPLLVVALVSAVFVAGRYTVAERIKTVEVVKTVEVHHESTQVTQRVDIEELLKKVQDKTKYIDRDVVRVVTIKPDGTRTETETDRSRIDSTQRTTTDSSTKVSEVAELKKLLDSYRAEDKSKTVTIERGQPNWRLGVLTGYSKDVKSMIPGIPNSILLGGFVERRILGPISAGIWANTYPGVGVQASVQF